MVMVVKTGAMDVVAIEIAMIRKETSLALFA